MNVTAVYRGYKTELNYRPGYSPDSSATSRTTAAAEYGPESQGRDDVVLDEGRHESSRHRQDKSNIFALSGYKYNLPFDLAQSVLVREKLLEAGAKSHGGAEQFFMGPAHGEFNLKVSQDREIQDDGREISGRENEVVFRDRQLQSDAVAVEKDEVKIAGDQIEFHSDKVQVDWDQFMGVGGPQRELFEPKQTYDPTQETRPVVDYPPVERNHKEPDSDQDVKAFNSLVLNPGALVAGQVLSETGERPEVDPASLGLMRSVRNLDRDVIPPYRDFQMPPGESRIIDEKGAIFNPETQRRDIVEIARGEVPEAAVHPTSYALPREPIMVGVEDRDVFSVSLAPQYLSLENRYVESLPRRPAFSGIEPHEINYAVESKELSSRLFSSPGGAAHDLRPGPMGRESDQAGVHSLPGPEPTRVRTVVGNPYDHAGHFEKRIVSMTVPEQSRDFETVQRTTRSVEKPPQIQDTIARKTEENSLYGRNFPTIQEVQRLVEIKEKGQAETENRFKEATRFPFYQANGIYRPDHQMERGQVVDAMVWGWSKER
ncbi:MAG: hypothetical protein V1742_12590 [Pseudomonadota bacterium]